MNPAHLSRMANDIGEFFGAEPRPEDRVAGVLDHLRRFWDRRMREQLLEHVRVHGGAELSEHVRAAVLALQSGPPAR